jgi:hypothetical protein
MVGGEGRLSSHKLRVEGGIVGVPVVEVPVIVVDESTGRVVRIRTEAEEESAAKE